MRLRHALLCAILLVSVPAAAAEYFLYAGSYTAGTSKGIYAWTFDSATGALEPVGLMAETPQPAHIWISPNGQFLYTVNWEKQGGVSAYRIDPKSGALAFLNRVSSHGAQPNQVVLDPSGRIAVTVNYTSGTMAAYKVEGDGRLSEPFYVARHSGKPLSPNQPGPKAHGIDFSKDGKWMYIAELGLDRVYVYRVDAAKPAITPHATPFVSTHAGAGPRRLQLSPDGRFLYVDHETDSEVSVFAVKGGALKEIQTLSTLPPGTEMRNTTAEILISGDGRHLYVTNRGHDSIAIFAIDRATGLLTRSENVPSGGRTPRNIRLSPDGDYLLAANENGGNITEFRVDKTNGHLTPTGVSVPIDTPGGLYFRKVR
jgi:6-phosphogluconolactonase